MPLKLITPPNEYPVTRDALVKVHIKVDGTDEDSLLDAYLSASTELVQNLIQQQLMQAVYEWQQDTWYDCAYKDYRYNNRDNYFTITKLPIWPVIAVNSIKYDDESNVEQTLDPSKYQVNYLTTPVQIKFIDTLPTVYDKPNAIRINFTAGYGALGNDADQQRASVPNLAKIGILRTVADLYENRQDESESKIAMIQKNVEYLLSTLRVYL